MKWDLGDVKRYLQHRQYVDTALIPVIKVSVGTDVEKSVRRAAWISGLANQLEEQLAGRILLLPPLTYTASHTKEELSLFLSKAGEEVNREIGRIVFLTAEPDWGEEKLELKHRLIQVDLEEWEEKPPDPSALFQCAQKYLPLLISLWQKG